MDKGSGRIFAVAALVVVLVSAAGTAVAQASDTVVPRVEIEFGRALDRETRMLVETGTEFPADIERVWCLTRVIGLEAPTSITHVWYHDGQTRARVDLKVGSSNWRTWSAKSMLAGWTGTWELKVLDADGTVLG
ncbi:hypothetical protein DRQ50_09745, partial [bacterium]